MRLSPRSLVVRPLTDLVRLVPLLAGLLLLHSGPAAGCCGDCSRRASRS